MFVARAHQHASTALCTLWHALPCLLQLQVCMISLGSADKVEELGKVVDAHKPK